METQTIRLLATAAENIISAAEITQDSGISELCATALETIRRALRRAVDGYDATDD
jgi:hypothetical protein